MIGFTQEQLKSLRSMTREETILYWDKVEEIGREGNSLTEVVRLLCLNDLYYLLVKVCGRVDMLNDFAFARCREVEANPDNHLDLWAREHWKSSVITFGLTIQDILKDPESKLVAIAHDIALSHHERFDGKGYPNKIASGDIPIHARVVSIADVFDALTSRRPYKEPFPTETAIEMIVSGGEKGQFDPMLVKAFTKEFSPH
jgi:hypothetical protein